MHIHDYYYDAKPFIPWNLRMMARRMYLRGRRQHCGDVWPVSEAAGRLPANWPGWPEGKKFAFVLTHDVEGEKGLQRCEQLMETERSLGFRSCFNFIPEGEYRVTPELRALLASNGFEVGVHDLYHDGKLYRSREGFRRSAVDINKYLKAWGAVGFRSGFMHHNIGWLHDLHIAYDSSTFDTDPFEPQPDGVGTIFPFWVEPPQNGVSVSQAPGNSVDRSTETPKHRPAGYLELPYTLPQDSTLFLLFNERSIDKWKLKLDWIASRGGMALLNAHPDYMRFDNDGRRGLKYPASLYQEFLTWVREKYAGQYWHATPREMASYCSPFRPRRAVPSRRVCMLTHSFYSTDARVTRYAEALAARGDHVDVLSLSSASDVSSTEKIGGVNLIRIQKRYGKTEKSHLGFLLPILRFLITGSFWIARSHRRKPYDLLHIHNIPDFLVFGGWIPKRSGAKIILDIHDIVPEFYASKFNRPGKSWGIKILRFAERLSARVADHVIIANHLWLEKYAARTGKNGACSVYINNVDTQIFTPRLRTRSLDKPIILFPGGLQWHQGLDIAIRAFQKVSVVIPQAEFHIYGDGNMKPDLVALAKELGLEDKVKFFKPLPVREIADVMANADLGVVPKRADSFGNEAYSTKIMEFMSLGVPVVVSSTKIDRYYFDDTVVRFFPSGDHEAMAREMIDLLTDRHTRERQVASAMQYAGVNSWDNRKHDYLALVDALIDGQPVRRPTGSPSQRPIESPKHRSTEELVH